MAVRKYLLGKATNDKAKVKSHLEALGFSGCNNFDESDALAVSLVVGDYVNKRYQITHDFKESLFDKFDTQSSHHK
jgi:Holliday junction resolvasome RuvABC endonuclease subunit